MADRSWTEACEQHNVWLSAHRDSDYIGVLYLIATTHILEALEVDKDFDDRELVERAGLVVRRARKRQRASARRVADFDDYAGPSEVLLLKALGGLADAHFADADRERTAAGLRQCEAALRTWWKGRD